MPMTHQDITKKREPKDGYSLGVSNEDQNYSAVAAFNVLLFFVLGFILTLVAGFTA